jgi:hypothetical protein
MGANFVDYTIRGGNEKYVQKKFDEMQEECLHENGHSYSGEIGMANGLKFTGKIFKSYAEAEEFLCDTAQKWEEALVCQYREGQGKHEGQLAWLIGAWCSS